MLPSLINLANPINRSHPLARGCVARWLTLPGLDGGKFWYDVMGMNHGTLTNMTTSDSGWRGTTRPGGFGHLLFDGSNDYVNVPYTVATDFAYPFWCTFWIAFTSTSNLVAIEKNANNGFSIQVNTGKIWINSGNGAFRHANTVSNYNDGLWHHVAVDFATTATNIYVGGVLDVTSDVSSAAPAYSGAPLHIGSRAGSFGLAGKLDSISFGSGGLSAKTAQDAYEESRRGYPTLLNRMTQPMFKRSSGGLLLARRRSAA